MGKAYEVEDSQENQFHRVYNLRVARDQPPIKTPSAHQHGSLQKLHEWFRSTSKKNKGGLLVLPTGGGKTFTAMRFLCTGPISEGYKLIWLAHTHHLLEQAFYGFGPPEGLEADGYEVANISEPKEYLGVRVVSGTAGHCAVSEISPADEVIAGTIQTVTRAYHSNHPRLEGFLDSVRDGKLIVVFDEAHHAPAPSYRMLIDALQTRFSKMCLLGLTATPTYTDERKRGWLKVLFPQGFIDQVTPQKLIAANILSRPQFEELRTNYVPTFDPREYEKWLGTYRDLPEHVIEHLASSRERNEAIASHYVENRDRYGKTIIFADRWFQCEALREALLRRKIRADVVYSHVDASGSTPDERNRRTRDENSLVLQRFRENKIDVLINVRMLTEGTDIPDVQTVFLTRQTTSRILLTQMIGRALRGPKFGGTEDAFIVSFIDDWKQAINWAEYRELDGDVDPTLTEVTKRPPLHLISIDLVRRLARQMDSGRNIASGPFATLLPLGWFRVEFQVLDEETDTLEATEHVIMVFEGQQESYERFIKSLKRSNLTDFASEDLLYEAVSTRIQKWRHQFFDDTTTSDSDIENNLLHIARHVAQTGGSVPQFFSFEERKNHDLDVVANTAIEQRLDPLALNESVRHEYERSDRYWRAIYGRYELFKTQFDACVNRQIGLSSTVTRDQNEKVYRRSKRRQREPSESTKRQVKIRDHYRCLCCGEDRRRRLEIDHINPYYLGGASDDLENLQTLCRLCNGFKGTNGWNYRLHESSHSKPGPFAMPAMPKDLGDADDWSRFVQRAINSAYGCSAVEAIRIGRRGKYFYRWEVTLYAGNDASGLKVGLSALLNQIRSTRSTAGYGGPDELVILPFKGRQVVCKSRK